MKVSSWKLEYNTALVLPRSHWCYSLKLYDIIYESLENIIDRHGIENLKNTGLWPASFCVASTLVIDSILFEYLDIYKYIIMDFSAWKI